MLLKHVQWLIFSGEIFESSHGDKEKNRFTRYCSENSQFGFSNEICGNN